MDVDEGNLNGSGRHETLRITIVHGYRMSTLKIGLLNVMSTSEIGLLNMKLW